MLDLCGVITMLTIQAIAESLREDEESQVQGEGKTVEGLGGPRSQTD